MTESQPLLGGKNLSVYNSKKSSGSYVARSLHLITIGLLLYLTFFGTKSTDAKPTVDVSKKKNVIFMVTDGMGPASVSLARSFRQFRDSLPIDDVLEIDKYLIGSSRTRSSNSLVTDSAAGATAFSCGLKTYNGAIGVTPDKVPCGTILEALKLQGYLTGLVVTTRITDATPASFSAHVDYRYQEDLIAEQQLGDYPLGRSVDLILGGGRTYFYGATKGGSRKDNRDLIKEAQKDGWSYVGDRKSFDELDGGENVTLPLLGLLADYDIPYDIDRDPKEYPSLAEEVRVALTALTKATKDSDKGFFLLIEGSRIDHCGHSNDPAAQVREVLAYDKAFAEVIDFIDASDVETVALSTSDHETGGLVTARQVSPNYPDYLWYPEVLLNSTHSGEYLAKKLIQYVSSNKHVDEAHFTDYIKAEIFEKDMGIKTYTSDEVVQAKIAAAANNRDALMYILNNIVSVRSQTGWTTHGHSAVDVNIYAHTNSEAIRNKLFRSTQFDGLLGNHENIELGAFMEEITGVSLDHISDLIKDTKHSPTAKAELNEEQQMHINAYVQE